MATRGRSIGQVSPSGRRAVRLLLPHPGGSPVTDALSTGTAEVVDQPPALSAARILAAVLVCGAAVLLFAVHVRPLGYVPLVLGVALGFVVDKRLGRDLGLIALGQVIISTISLKADLSNLGMLKFTLALGLAVVVPTVLSSRVFHDDTIHFP